MRGRRTAVALMFWLGALRYRKRKEEGEYCRDCFYYEYRTDEKGWCNVKKGSVGWNSVCQQFLARAKV